MDLTLQTIIEQLVRRSHLVQVISQTQIPFSIEEGLSSAPQLIYRSPFVIKVSFFKCNDDCLLIQSLYKYFTYKL